MSFNSKNDEYSENDGQSGEIIGKLRQHLEKVIQELDRVNKIAFQQEDQIEFLRNRLDEVVEKCNSQAYLIHEYQEKLRITKSISNDKFLKENLSLGEEEKKKISDFVESVFENRAWSEEGKKIEVEQEYDKLRMRNIEMENTNKMLMHEREVLVEQIKFLKGGNDD